MPLTPEQLIRDDILRLSAYHVPASAGFVKLDAMENPYRLPESLREALGHIAAEACLNRYPDPSASALKARLREVMNVPDGMDLLLGNGSDELIQIVAMALARPGAVMLGVEPSFVMYRMIAAFCGMRYEAVPLRADFTLDVDACLEAIDRLRPALIFIAYPNNPTGNLFDPKGVSRMIEASSGLVVVDEAYYAFADASFLPRLAKYPNLLLMRTVSKLGLAGLRLGVLAGHPAWIAELDKVRLPYNINVLTQLLAERVLGERQVLDDQAGAIRSERGRLISALARFKSVEVFPSRANFILFRVSFAAEVFAALKAHHVLLKSLHGTHPLLADCLRVTVGTPAENDLFLQALDASLVECATRAAGT
jgi:histidinol-phosphate aminotransferase